jgi:hypothetical protein
MPLSADPDLVGLLIPIDPRAAVDRILAFMMGQHRARGGAVVTVGADGDLTLYAGHDFPLDRLVTVQRLWRGSREQLEAGATVRGPRHLLTPVFTRTRLVGLVFLDEPKEPSDRRMPDYLAAIGQALAASPRGSRVSRVVQDYLGSVPDRDIQREQLQLLLERNEWNISRVARILGKTRRTIYLRLQRFGIPRKRVAKSGV